MSLFGKMLHKGHAKVQLTEQGEADYSGNPHESVIIEYLISNHSSSVKEIAEHCGTSEKEVEKELKNLSNRGSIEFVG